MVAIFIPLSQDEEYPTACPAFLICKRCRKRGLLRMVLRVAIHDAARPFILFLGGTATGIQSSQAADQTAVGGFQKQVGRKTIIPMLRTHSRAER
jgi:hypothetical protein